MKVFFSFAKTVIGQLHIQKKIPCEDSSGSFSDPEGRYHIAIVADGHGDPACFRSKIGSQIAVEVSTASLQNFAERFFPSESDMQSTMAKTLAIPKERRQAVKQLTDFIISQWTSGALKHLEENPPTEADWEKVGDKKAEYLEGKHLEHIYGTTLIAALMVSNWLILIQQGDGRCDVFYEDGTVVPTNVGDTTVDKFIRVYTTYRFTVNKYDIREYFKITQGSTMKSLINSAGLIAGYNGGNAVDGYPEYHNVRGITTLNMENQELKDSESKITFIYRLFIQ